MSTSPPTSVRFASKRKMETSTGSDGERSSSCSSSPRTPSTSPHVHDTSHWNSQATQALKFSIANILKPDFGHGNATALMAQQLPYLQPLAQLARAVSAATMPPFTISKPSSVCRPTPVTLVSPSPKRPKLDHRPSQTKLASPVSSCPTPASDDSQDALNLTQKKALFPAWVYCTRYSDRPSSGPRCRRIKRKAEPVSAPAAVASPPTDEKRPRTAFTSEQLNRLKAEFTSCRYLTEKRRQELAHELGLNESQIKIWFQNKRAKIKKQTGNRNALAMHLMAQGLYNHATVPVLDEDSDKDDDC